MLRMSLLLLFLLTGPQLAASSTILVVGDSLSASYGIPVQQGWVALLQQRLLTQCGECNSVNASISGDTTASARARLPQALSRHQPDVVILELGGNDGLRGLSLAEMKANLAAMISIAREREARVLLIGVQLPPNYGTVYTQKFHTLYQELAREQGVALLPSLVEGVGTRADLMQGDGIHPNVEAQPLIMARVWEHLLPLLAEH
jgi:acyl-CoA thioesterase-1